MFHVAFATSWASTEYRNTDKQPPDLSISSLAGAPVGHPTSHLAFKMAIHPARLAAATSNHWLKREKVEVLYTLRVDSALEIRTLYNQVLSDADYT